MDDKRRQELLKIVEKSYKTLDKTVQHRLAVAFDALIFNMTAFLCLIAIINDRKSITAEDMEQLNAYVESKCASRAAWLARMAEKAQVGGGPMPASFYGFKDIGNYSAMNVAPDPLKTQTINFPMNTARAEIRGGASAKTAAKVLAGNKDISKMIESIVNLHEMQIKKTDITKVQKLFDVYIQCFIGTMKPEELTVENINRELRKPFNIMFQ